MLKILIGVALTLLSFDKTLSGGNVIELIPHFVGFMLILFGAREMDKKGPFFARIQLPAFIMMIYSFAYFDIKILGLASGLAKNHGLIIYFIDLIEAAGALYVCYLVVFAMTNLQHKMRCDLGCKKLQKFWKAIAVINVVYFISYITVVTMSNKAFVLVVYGFNFVCMLGAVLFILVFYDVWQKYVEMQ